MSATAWGLPDISERDVEALGHPELVHRRPQSFAVSATTARVAPISRAVARRPSSTSVITMWRAPAWRDTAHAICPIGPAPVISTSSPTRSNDSAVCTALPSGSRIAAMASGTESGIGYALRAGITTYSAKPPSRWIPDADRRPAQVAVAGAAVAAVPAHDVALAGDPGSGLDVVDLCTDGLDDADELVADDDGRAHVLLRPFVPVVDVQIGAADRRVGHPDQHVRRTGHRLRNVLQHEPPLRARLDERLHDAAPMMPSSVPTSTNASTARSMSSEECAAFICVRIRAVPCGTTGNENAVT